MPVSRVILAMPFLTGFALSDAARVEASSDLGQDGAIDSSNGAWRTVEQSAGLLIHPDMGTTGHRVIADPFAVWSPKADVVASLSSKLTEARLPAPDAIQMRIRAGEHGVGVVSILIEFPRPLEAMEREQIENVSPDASYSQFVTEQVVKATGRLRSHLEALNVLTEASEFNLGGADDQFRREPGVQLWVHRLWLEDDESDVYSSELSDVATNLGRNVRISNPGWSAIIGDGSSIATLGPDGDDAIERLLLVLEYAEIYWSLLNEYDSQYVHLLRVFSAAVFEGGETRTTSNQVEHFGTRAMTIVHEGKSLTAGLPPTDAVIWEAFLEAWRVGLLEESLREKADMASSLDRVLSERADRRWQTRFNWLAVILGIAGLVSAFADAVAFMQIDKAPQIDLTRVTILLAFALVVTLLILHTFRRGK